MSPNPVTTLESWYLALPAPASEPAVGSIVCVAMLEPLPRPLVATGRDGTPLTVWTAHMVRAGIVVPRRSRTTPYDGLAIRDRSPWPQRAEEPDEPDGFVAVWLDHPALA